MIIRALVSFDPTTAGPGYHVPHHPACAVGLGIAGAPGLLGATLAVPLGILAHVRKAAEYLAKCGAHCLPLVVEGTTRVPDFQCNRAVAKGPDFVHRSRGVGADTLEMKTDQIPTLDIFLTSLRWWPFSS